MKPSILASGCHTLICPICKAGGLRSAGHHHGVRCPVCTYAPSPGVLEALRQIISLPDALGSHACEECGHPQMRRLPDGVFWCPACGSEVLPARSECHAEAVSTSRGRRRSGGKESQRIASTDGFQEEARDASAGRR
jgi:ribosomal protein L37AE/L43A